jgi:hypothetical protein
MLLYFERNLIFIHSDFNYNLVTFFELNFFLLKIVLKTYHHIMLNPSWDTSR